MLNILVWILFKIVPHCVRLACKNNDMGENNRKGKTTAAAKPHRGAETGVTRGEDWGTGGSQRRFLTARQLSSEEWVTCHMRSLSLGSLINVEEGGAQRVWSRAAASAWKSSGNRLRERWAPGSTASDGPQCLESCPDPAATIASRGGWRNKAPSLPRDVHVLIPKTCEHVTVHGRCD